MSRIAIVGDIKPSARKPALTAMRLPGSHEYLTLTADQLHLAASVVLPLFADGPRPKDLTEAAATAVAQLVGPVHAVIVRAVDFEVDDPRINPDDKRDGDRHGYSELALRTNMETLFSAMAAGNGTGQLTVAVLGDSHFVEVHHYHAPR